MYLTFNYSAKQLKLIFVHMCEACQFEYYSLCTGAMSSFQRSSMCEANFAKATSCN